MTMHNTEKVWTHTYMFPEKCSTVPGDVGNFLHTVVMITHTVIKNARHDEGQIEGKKKKKKRTNENGIKTHEMKTNNYKTSRQYWRTLSTYFWKLWTKLITAHTFADLALTLVCFMFITVVKRDWSSVNITVSWYYCLLLEYYKLW